MIRRIFNNDGILRTVKRLLLVASLCFPTWAAVTCTPHTLTTNIVNAPGTTSAIDTTGTNLLVILVTDIGKNFTSVTDSKSNSWTALTSQTNNGGEERMFYSAGSPTVGASHTFTVNGGNSFFGTIAVLACSGLASSSTFESQNGNTNNSFFGVTSIQPGSVTPNTSGDLIVTGFAHNNAANTPTINLSYTTTDSCVNNNGYGAGLAYLVTSSTASSNPTWTIGGTDNYVSATIAVFAAAGGASPTPAASKMRKLQKLGELPLLWIWMGAGHGE